MVANSLPIVEGKQVVSKVTAQRQWTALRSIATLPEVNVPKTVPLRPLPRPSHRADHSRGEGGDVRCVVL